MNEKIKKLWISALRSGKYKQGRTVLHDPIENTYCCLGVLCDLYRKEIGSDKTVKQLRKLKADGKTPDEVPNEEVVKWAELPSANPTPDNYDINVNYYSLAELNDNGHGFSQIADMIENCNLTK